MYYSNAKECKRHIKQLDSQIAALQKEREEALNRLARFPKDNEEEKNPNEEVWGLHWDFTYCSHYVGEKGMYTDAGHGTEELSEEEVNLIRECIKGGDSDAIGEIIAKYSCKHSDYIWTNTITYGNYTVSDEKIHWKTEQKGYNDGQMRPGTYFEIKRMTRQSIENADFYFEEDISPC